MKPDAEYHDKSLCVDLAFQYQRQEIVSHAPEGALKDAQLAAITHTIERIENSRKELLNGTYKPFKPGAMHL